MTCLTGPSAPATLRRSVVRDDDRLVDVGEGDGEAEDADEGDVQGAHGTADDDHRHQACFVVEPEVGEALSDAVTYMAGKGIPLDAKWRDYQYVTKNGEKIAIPGGPGGQGVFNVITAIRNLSGTAESAVPGAGGTLAFDDRSGSVPSTETGVPHGWPHGKAVPLLIFPDGAEVIPAYRTP